MRPNEPAKSTVDEIRARFDADVERFADLETGQSSTIDAPLALELLIGAAAAVRPDAGRLLDVGCGAGNWSLKLLARLPELRVTLLDLSRPMLDRATERLTAAGIRTPPVCLQGDLREIELPAAEYDVIFAGAVLHHLRTDAEWEAAFRKIHTALRPGGCVWIFDLVAAELPAVEEIQRQRYAAYLERLGGPDYRAKVFEYIAREDSPRSLTYQTELLKAVGFRAVEVLHHHVCFAAFGAVKSP